MYASRMHCLIASCALAPRWRVAAGEAPAFPVHGVLPGRECHVLPSIATFPDCEADQLHPAERACIGFEDHLRIGKLPCGLPCSFGMIFTDTSSPLDLDMVFSKTAEGLGPKAAAGSRGSKTPANGVDARP